MPFKSEAQRRYLYAKEPAVAEEFAEHTLKGEKLPQHAKKSKGHLSKLTLKDRASARATALADNGEA